MRKGDSFGAYFCNAGIETLWTGNAGCGCPSDRAIVRVPVKDRTHTESIDGFLQARRAEERKHFGRLAFASLANRRIMQQNNATLRLQFDQGLLETHRLVRIESSRLVWFYLSKREDECSAGGSSRTNQTIAK
jgi:hypothetical protein